jgi:glycosyltransferase involved in cell wall biosynthesis
VSVVISTYNRREACERALRSVLAQTERPLEIIVCDNGSTDDTETRLREWEQREPLVRYLRQPVNSGTPATSRNAGIEHAQGELIAFLDDDDEWLAGKLALQLDALMDTDADVVATNALRSGGRPYFEAAPAVWRPTRTDLMRANPIITSSVLVRRESLLSTGGFPTDIRARGLEDYVAWLDLALTGARFLIIGDTQVRYEDVADDRLSLDRAHIQLAVARLMWWHALRRPVRVAGLSAALRHSAGVIHVLGGEAVAAVRARLHGGRSAPQSGV